MNQSELELKYMSSAPSAGKLVRTTHNWFWFYFWLVEKVVGDFFSQLQSVAMQNQSNCEITLKIDIQLKTALIVVISVFIIVGRRTVERLGSCSERDYLILSRVCLTSFVHTLQKDPKKSCRLVNCCVYEYILNTIRNITVTITLYSIISNTTGKYCLK